MAGQKLNKFEGTLLYLTPEIIQWKECEGPMVDVYSLGVILYFVLIRRYQYMANTTKQLKKRFMQARYDNTLHISKEAWSLIS